MPSLASIGKARQDLFNLYDANHSLTITYLVVALRMLLRASFDVVLHDTSTRPLRRVVLSTGRKWQCMTLFLVNRALREDVAHVVLLRGRYAPTAERAEIRPYPQRAL